MLKPDIHSSVNKNNKKSSVSVRSYLKNWCFFDWSCVLDQVWFSHGPFCCPISESLIRGCIKSADCAPVLGITLPLLGCQSDLGLWTGFVRVNPAGTCRVGSVGLKRGVLNSRARLLSAQMDGHKLQGQRQEPWPLLRSPLRTWKEQATLLSKEPPTLQVEKRI